MSTPSFEHLHLGRHPGLSFRGRVWREWCFVRVLFRHFALRSLIMIGVLFGGAAAFKYLGGDPSIRFFKAVWHTWLLIFGEPPGDFPDSLILDILYFLMPIIGLTVILEGIIDFALMLRDRKRYERSWCEMMASSMSDHVILVGFGRLGFSTYLLLRKLRESVVVIERDSGNQFLEEVRRDGIPLFIGDARREALLLDANVKQAKSIIVATNDDLANLEIALDARRFNPEILVVLRMFDQNMASKVGEGFRIHTAMSQSAVSAPAFAMSAVDPSIVHSFIVGDDLVVLQQWTVRSEGPLEGRTVGEVMREYGVTIVKRRRGDAEPQLFPPPEAALTADDRLLVQGPYDHLRRLSDFTVART